MNEGKAQPRDSRGRLWSDAVAPWSTLKTAGNHPTTRRSRRDRATSFPQKLEREHDLADTRISDFWPPELGENKFLFVLSHQAHGDLLWQL